MATSEPVLSVPESILLLATIAPDIARRFEDVVANYRSESAAKRIAPLLDALTFFLPTIPNDGRAYAMTLGENGQEIVITIAANDATHLDAPPEGDYPFPECQQSPEVILKTIWGFMTTLSAAPDHSRASMATSAAIIIYLYRTHTLNIRHHFAKQSKNFERFWEAVSKTARDTFSSNPDNAIADLSVDIKSSGFTLHEALHDGEQSASGFTRNKEKGAVGHTSSRMSETLKSYLDAAKILYDRHKEFYSTNDVHLLVLLEEWRTLSQLEKSLSVFDRAYLENVCHADKNKFDLFSYMNELESPMSHMKVIIRFATSRAFKQYSSLSLRVRTIANPSVDQVQAFVVSPELVADFLRHTDQRSREDEVEYLEAAIQERSANVCKSIIRISEPHCECLLIRHHALADPMDPPPLPYIAVSKLPCFQCRMYIDAYNACTEKTKFTISGRCNDIVPCNFPTISSDADALIFEQMRQWIGAVVTALLDADTDNLKLYKFSQSNSGSVDNDSSIDDFFIGVTNMFIAESLKEAAAQEQNA